MLNYKFFVDTCCDIPDDLAKTSNIDFIHLSISFGDRQYKDMIDVTPLDVIKMVDDPKSFPKTSAISTTELVGIFNANLVNYEYIYYLTLSSFSSSTYQNAILAKNNCDKPDNVIILDSLTISSGIGVLALAAIDDINNGLSSSEILERHNDRAKRTRMMFLIDSMKYLYRGGRCSGLSYLVGNAFHIHPIANVKDGKLSVYALTRGKDITKSLKRLIEIFQEDFDQKNIDFSTPILIPHVLAEDGVKKLIKDLKNELGDKLLRPVSAGSTVTCHTGSSDTIGLAYIMKKQL